MKLLYKWENLLKSIARTAPLIKQKLKLNVSIHTIQWWIKKLGVNLFNLKQKNRETLNFF
jgi:hypothetical protein